MPTPMHRLVTRVPPPGPPARREWASVERCLGTRLPDDYKDIVTWYGDGLFFDAVSLWMPIPGDRGVADRGPGEVEGCLALAHDIVAGSDDPEFARLPDGRTQEIDWGQDPDTLPFLSWGTGSDGDTGFWHRVGDDPNRWPVLFGQLTCWDYHPAGLAAFLAATIDPAHHSNCFPEPPPATFTPFD